MDISTPFNPRNLPDAVGARAGGRFLCCNRNNRTLMASVITKLRRRAKALHRNLRGANMAIGALASTDHPLLAHIIPMRRCNWPCPYCNGFDVFPKPVPIDKISRPTDKRGSLGPAVVTISGGEP